MSNIPKTGQFPTPDGFWVYPIVRQTQIQMLGLWLPIAATSQVDKNKGRHFFPCGDASGSATCLDVDTTRHSTLWVNPQHLSVAISWSFFHFFLSFLICTRLSFNRKCSMGYCLSALQTSEILLLCDIGETWQKTGLRKHHVEIRGVDMGACP